ncbi:MAG: cytochrome c [Geothrix sp.]|uniref:c-type cytochrome n=1 Tax=Geothrix sp. TaxID=1962974 RepID=UPI003BAF2E51
MRSPFLLSPFILCTGLLANPPAKTVAELKSFYAASCVKCHGADGSATADGKKLGGRDFTDAAKNAKETDADMAKTIRKGIFFGTVMPAFKDRLSEEDALLLVKEIVRKAEKGKVIAP